jgi:transposase
MALAADRADWLVGFQDETWWSREARPSMQAWAAHKRPLRLVAGQVADDDPEPKALACYGVWLPDLEQTWLRFVDGRPVSGITTQYLAWCARQAQTHGARWLVLLWDNASWHLSREVRTWVRTHNQTVQRAGSGVKLVPCPLPSKSPWLNQIEPKWRHAKRRIIEPARVLSLAEIEARVCQVLHCPSTDRLSLPKKVA